MPLITRSHWELQQVTTVLLCEAYKMVAAMDASKTKFMESSVKDSRVLDSIRKLI